MKKWILSLVLLILIGLLVFFMSPHSASESPYIPLTINDQEILVEVVDTPEERALGLMNREHLDKDKGMLFVYDAVQPQLSFWMKNTLIPLDMVFIADDHSIVHISKNAQPCGNITQDQVCPGYVSSKPAQYVLELNGGYTDQFDIQIGDRVDFEL